METILLNLVEYFSLETLIIAICVFILTMLIKWPIKKITNKYNEDKRKALNTIIIFIPMILSIIGVITYLKLFKNVWYSSSIYKLSFSSWVISLTVYALFDRVYIIIKGIKSGKIKVDSKEVKETYKTIKNTIKELSSKIKADEKQMNKLKADISALLEIKKILESEDNKDIAKIFHINTQLKDLMLKEEGLNLLILDEQSRLEDYKNKINQ